MPIIKTCPLKASVVNAEAERLDKMKPCVHGGAGSGDIACILRYFGFNKNYIQSHIFTHNRLSESDRVNSPFIFFE